MTKVPITLHVDPKIAKAFESASKEERNKIEAVLRLRLKEVLVPTGITLREAIDQVRREAEENGLSPEILESILRGEDDVVLLTAPQRRLRVGSGNFPRPEGARKKIP